MKPRPASVSPSPADVFRLAFQNSPAMQTVSRVSDRLLIEVNDAFLRTLGYTREEVIGREAPEQDFWVNPGRAQPFREELMAKGRVRGFEVQVYTKTREIRTILLSADLVELQGVPHVLAAGVDITARMESEARLQQVHAQLRQSEERFRLAFRANPAVVALTRKRDGRYVSVNAAYAAAYGCTEAEFVGRTSIEMGVFTAEERARFIAALQAQGALRDYEIPLRGQDGRVRQLLISTDAVEFEGEAHLLTVGIDITDRKAMELRLRESESRFNTAFSASPVLMTIASLPDGRFIEVNDAFVNLLGLTRAEAIGRSSAELGIWVDPEDRHKFYALVQPASSVRNVECRIRDRQGVLHTIAISAECVEINRQPHLLTFGVDVTLRKAAEAEQARAFERERELHQLKSDFVALVSHEFRTPLEIIMSSADNLDRYLDRLKPEQRRQLLGTINKSVRRMTGMMEDVLLLGRLEGEATEFQPVAFDVASLVRRLGEEMETATQRRCPITCRATGDFADARGDETVLRHILSNLLSNAVKYSAPGAPVRLELRREGASAVLEVSDRGCGIPAADQSRLFQAFHRGSNVRQIPGTGLGLLIVHRCVGLHGGEITFATAEGQGATFTVRLPLWDGNR